MNKSIFQIDRDFAEIFAELEDNGGELTPELEDKLQISQEEMTRKVKNCCDYINSLKADIAAIKSEEDRLKSLRKSKENAIKGITNLVVFAIKNYGNEDKKGKKFIDWTTGKVSIRVSKALNVEDEKLEALADIVKHTYAGGAYTNTLQNADAIDMESLFDALQHNVDEETGEAKPVEVEESDLNDINAEVTFTVPMDKLLGGEPYQAMATIACMCNSWNIKPNIDKAYLKAKLTEGYSSNVCEVVENETLNIK